MKNKLVESLILSSLISFGGFSLESRAQDFNTAAAVSSINTWNAHSYDPLNLDEELGEYVFCAVSGFSALGLGLYFIRKPRPVSKEKV